MKRKDDRNEPSTPEKVSMVLSALVTIALFGYTSYMGVTAPEQPDLGVEVVRTEQKADAVHVHVEVTNHGSKGYSSVTVEADCAKPAPSVTIPNLPIRGKKPVVLVCPPDTSGPNAKLVSMVPA